MRTSAHCAILRVKSPPRLEPWDIQQFLERSVAVKGRENTSAPQNGILSQTQQGIPPQGFQNHIPARGRKLLRLGRFFILLMKFQNHIPARGRKQSILLQTIASNLRISKPYPRKGTETMLNSGIAYTYPYFKTISPQGDGNETVALKITGLSHFKTISPQGDGNI